MKIKTLVLGTALAMFVLSCSQDDSNNPSGLNEAKVSSKIDMATEDIAKIVEDQYSLQANPGAGRTTQDFNQENTLPSCATVTVTLTETTWTRTVTFDNCTLPNGNVLDGTVIASGSLNFDTPSYTINYSFVDFHHNNILIEGNKTVVRTVQSTAALATAHPVATMAIDLTATFPNGNSYHRVGNRVREMIEGFGTPLLWADNVFLITGNWTTAFPNGTQSSTITTPLRVEVGCPHIVSGEISIVRNDTTAILNYGNGDCDNQATLTINGNTVTIIL